MLRSLFIFFFSISLAGLAQSYWVQKAGGITIDEGMDVSSDGAGNTYTTGYFSSGANFGTLTLSVNGVTDIFVSKNTPTGTFAWAVKAGGTGPDRGLSIKSDNAGNTYITGYYSGTATFGSQTLTSLGSQDIFIAKIDPNGTFLWARSAGGVNNDIGYGIDVDNNGNVAVTGEFTGTGTFGSFNLTSMNGSIDVFTTKLDGLGNFLWAKRGAAKFTDKGHDVAFDGTGNVYITGEFSDTITFDIVHNNNMLNAVFTVKYNAAGQEQWFRKIGGGSNNVSNAIESDANGNIYIAGDFNGTITFFGPNTTLSNTYPNRIFLAKYDNAGTLSWAKSNGENDPVTVRNLALDAAGDPFMVGNFKCQFNEYADNYASQGLFRSAGYWDIFVTKYNSGGTWQWSRQVGGHQENLGNGIAVHPSGEALICGSFDQNQFFPLGATGFLGYGGSWTNIYSPYCNDQEYGSYYELTTNGNYDIFTSRPIDVGREPYDIFNRSGPGCARDTVDVCINTSLTYTCPDSVVFCSGGWLYAITSIPIHGPQMNFLWNTGSTMPQLYVTTTGWYWVTETTADGCFSLTDSIYVTVNPPPLPPLISDNVIINTNAQFPQQIILCVPDTALLWATNFGNNSFVWTGPGLPVQGVPNDSVFALQTGYYFFTVTDTNGCTRTNSVYVQYDSLLPPWDPEIALLYDLDLNDSVEFCAGFPFQLLVYDSLTNPTAQIVCLPNLTPFSTNCTWTVTPVIPFSAQCTANNLCFFYPPSTGWYNVSVTVVRTTKCDTDTVVLVKNVHATIWPLPSVSIFLSGDTLLCPGDSLMLVASGGSNYLWNAPTNGIVGGNGFDTVLVNLPGIYGVTTSDTNQYGCIASATVSVTVLIKPQPLLVTNPGNGLICPGDSVQLLVNTIGNYQWIGPNGPFGGSNNPVYASIPGYYYVIVTDADSCQLVSNTVQIVQYNTPSLQASPSATICPGDTVWVTVFSSPGATINWLPPLSGNDTIQIITSPGTYYCAVTSCNITSTISVTVLMSNPQVTATSIGPLAFCQGDSTTLVASSGFPSYLWTPSQIATSSMVVYNSGTYTVTVTDQYGCTASDSITVNAYPNNLPQPTVGDETICQGQDIELLATGSPLIVWLASPTGPVLETGDDFFIPYLLSTTTYYLYSDSASCKSPIDTVTVFVEDCPDTIPNVFTPNGDGINDFFTLFKSDAIGLNCKIYNRWGNLIYEWDGQGNSWDGTVMQTGKPASDGVYYYVGTFFFRNERVEQVVGFVQLIRGQ
jgi:gliding motility-associated-like protein